MDPQFRFCASADGTRIAYAVYGNGPPLLSVALSVSMDAHFTIPEPRAFLDALASRATLVMFDARGMGASARDVDDPSPEAAAHDLAAVADAAGFERFTLFTDGAALAAGAQYAAEHQDRIDRVVAWAPWFPADYRELAAAARDDWSYLRRVVAGKDYPDGPVSLQRAWSKAMKDTQSAEVFARYREALAEVDLDVLLPRVTAPALVLQREERRRQDMMRVAGLLPHGEVRFIAGAASPPFPGHEPIVDAVFEFIAPPVPGAPLRSGGLSPRGPAAGASRTIFYTDIEGNTDMLQRLGDDAWRAVLRDHERITRELLRAHDGAEVKAMGDGFMASFASATSAVECAIGLQRAFASRNKTAAERMLVRVGLNAGEPISEDDDLFGTAVTMAARIMGQGSGGEILASDVVRALVAGKGFVFGDRGEFVPKGFDEGVRLWDVRWQE